MSLPRRAHTAICIVGVLGLALSMPAGISGQGIDSLILGVVAAGFGAIIGATSQGERWRRVDLQPPGNVRLQPLARMAKLGIALRF